MSVSFCLFLGPCTCGIWRFPGKGSNWSCCCQPTPQSQQCQIRAVSVTYTTAHGNMGSLTHWARLGMEPESSWVLVKFLSTEPWQEPPKIIFLWNVSLLNVWGSALPSIIKFFAWSFMSTVAIYTFKLTEYLTDSTHDRHILLFTIMPKLLFSLKAIQ